MVVILGRPSMLETVRDGYNKHPQKEMNFIFCFLGAESHLVSPRAQNTFSTLLIGLDINTGLLFQQVYLEFLSK